MRVAPVRLLTAGDMSANVESAVQNLNQDFGFAMQAVYVGAPVGTIKLQASVNGVDYGDVANSSFAVSAAGTSIWNVQSEYLWIKVVYVATSGSGSLDVYIITRGF